MMKIDKYKVLAGLLGFAVLGVTMLLVRENEGRVAAETKLNDLKYKMETTANESDNVILDLRNSLHEQEVRIADMTAKHQDEINQKSAQIQALNSEFEDAAKKFDETLAEKNTEWTESQAKAKAESDKLNLVIKEKSAKINELGDELEKASRRYAVLLKEKESLEAKSLSYEADISSLKSDLKKAQREKDRLSEAIRVLTQKPETPHD